MLRRRREVDHAATLPQDLATLRSAVGIGEPHLPSNVVEGARSLVLRADQRQNLAAGRTVVALLGATGSGKSSLFNAIVGRPVSRVAATRPTTARPLAAVWGPDDAGDLLDWLGVPDRTRAGDGPVDPDAGAAVRRLPARRASTTSPEGLVLLDLPDIDSTAEDHRRIASRMASAVDVLVWVLDPQKYADAIVHRDYLAPMAAHADVTVVVLNQVDTLEPGEREGILRDLAGILERDGLRGVPVLPVSARTGEGVPELRERIDSVVASTRAAQLRLAADVRTAAAHLLRAAEVTPDGEPTTGVEPRQSARLIEAAARAAGVDAVQDAVRGSYVRAARRHVGWPPVRWLARLRPDPMRRLHLDKQAPEARLVRTSLPGPTPVQEAAVRSAAHAMASTATRHLPDSWRADVLQDTEARVPGLVDSLDQQVGAAELEQTRRPAWWRVLGFLQWVFLAAAIAGGLWLAALAVMGYLQLPAPETPMAGPLPWPTVLLGGGVVVGLLLALVGGIAARVGARRRSRRVARRLREVVAGTVREQVVGPLEGELADFARFWRELTSLAR
ncbi:GTPase [Georgenia sp. M64]|uniref:GTPase family protein n=1 Tax=Georgenia sp. M64 TaxID=3120520 RepID=UPI0030DFE627